MSLHLKLSRASLLPLPSPEIELDTSPSSPLDNQTYFPQRDSLYQSIEDAVYQDAARQDRNSDEDDDVLMDDGEDGGEDELALIRRERKQRWFALFVACLLSVGSHL